MRSFLVGKKSIINFISIAFALAFVAAGYTFPTAVYAEDTLTVTQSGGNYTPGENYTLTVDIVYTGTLSSLGLDVTLPEGGWDCVPGDGTNFSFSKVTNGHFEAGWITAPQTPVKVTLTLKVPANADGLKDIVTKAIYTRTAGTQEAAANPLQIRSSGVTPSEDTLKATHSAGTYFQGGNLTVTAKIEYTGTVASVGMTVTMPTGWEFVSAQGAQSRINTASQLELFWLGEMPTSPVDFTYTLKAPDTAVGTQEFYAQVT